MWSFLVFNWGLPTLDVGTDLANFLYLLPDHPRWAYLTLAWMFTSFGVHASIFFAKRFLTQIKALFGGAGAMVAAMLAKVVVTARCTWPQVKPTTCGCAQTVHRCADCRANDGVAYRSYSAVRSLPVTPSEDGSDAAGFDGNAYVRLPAAAGPPPRAGTCRTSSRYVKTWGAATTLRRRRRPARRR